jgi:hypothetical protein
MLATILEGTAAEEREDTYTNSLPPPSYVFRPFCQRCRIQLATERFLPCGHTCLCAECCQVYADTVWPLDCIVCPFCASEVYKIKGTRGKLYYTPSVGYCHPDYLRNRVFIAPGGISWTYCNSLADRRLIDKLTNIVSIEGSEIFNIQWNSPQLEYRKEGFVIDLVSDRSHLHRSLQSRLRYRPPDRPIGETRNSFAYTRPN